MVGRLDQAAGDYSHRSRIGVAPTRIVSFKRHELHRRSVAKALSWRLSRGLTAVRRGSLRGSLPCSVRSVPAASQRGRLRRPPGFRRGSASGGRRTRQRRAHPPAPPPRAGANRTPGRAARRIRNRSGPRRRRQGTGAAAKRLRRWPRTPGRSGNNGLETPPQCPGRAVPVDAGAEPVALRRSLHGAHFGSMPATARVRGPHERSTVHSVDGIRGEPTHPRPKPESTLPGSGLPSSESWAGLYIRVRSR